PPSRARLRCRRSRRLRTSESRSRGNLHEPDRRPPLKVDGGHPLGVIAGTGSSARRKDLVEPLQVRIAEVHVERADIVVEIPDVLGAGDWDNFVTLSKHPRQGQLSRSATLLRRHLSDLSDELDVLLEILTLKARVVLAEITLLKVVRRFDLTGQEPAAERRISDVADAELADRWNDLILRIAAPQRQFGLDRRDG